MMKNNVNKKESNFKKLIPAAGMLAVSATMLATSTYAWFSMNTQVTATGMQVKAQAEGGIVISNSAKTAWSAEATAQVTTASLFPTSYTNVGSEAGTWYHNKSDDADNAKANQEAGTYDTLTTALSATSEGVGYVDSNGTEGYQVGADSAYYLLNNFTIKSSGDAVTGGKLYINDVTVKSSSTLLPIDCALRVAVVVGGTTYIFAPVTSTYGDPAQNYTPTYTYHVKGSSSNTTALYGASAKNVETSITTIPNTDAGVPVQVYCYFEGEDANCKSTNISGITVDTITVNVKFGTTTIA